MNPSDPSFSDHFAGSAATAAAQIEGVWDKDVLRTNGESL